MSNALAVFQATATGSVEALDQKLKAGQANLPQTAGGIDILRMDAQTGKFVFGQESVPVEDGTEWAVNPFSFVTGWVCWADPKINKRSEKLGEVMHDPANAPACPPLTPEQQAAGGEWKEQVGFRLVCITEGHEDHGTEVLYQNSSLGALKAYKEVYDAVVGRPSHAHCFPIVTTGSAGYHNKTYNRTVYNPVFEIVDWSNFDNERLSGGQVKAVTKDEETSGAGATATSSPAPEAGEAEATGRRRRRRTA
jgi:hypothetical protein